MNTKETTYVVSVAHWCALYRFYNAEGSVFSLHCDNLPQV